MEPMAGIPRSWDSSGCARTITELSPPDAGTVWHLHGKVREGETARPIPLQVFPFSVGRRTNLSLTLDFPTVSGVHAEILDDNGQLLLRDLHSTNGTYVNGIRLQQPQVLRIGDLVQFANVAFRVGQQSDDCKKTIAQDVIEDVLGLVHFEELLDGVLLTPHFQPILRYRDDRVIGFEALARSMQPGLETAPAMFRAAEQLRLESDLSRVLRRRALETGQTIGARRELFVNTHPSEMSDRRFLRSLETLREDFPAQQITIEIHELAATDAATMLQLRNELDRLDMRLAYDDFGAGQARLLELIEVRPDYLKFDRSLLKNIHLANAEHQDAVAALVRMTRKLGVVSVAEGIECVEEDQLARQLGFELGQGYHYGRPAPPGNYAAEPH